MGRVLSVRGMREHMEQGEMTIDGVLPSNAVSMVYGETQAGKSFLMIDWSGHIVTGRDWAGRKVKQGPVAYIVTEDEDDYLRRLDAWGMEYGENIDDLPFHFFPDGVQLLCSESVDSLIADLKALPQLPVLVVIDTLGKALTDCGTAAEGETNATEANRALMNAERIRKATGAAVVLVNHPTKPTSHTRSGTPRASKNMRGSAAFKQGSRMVARLEGMADAGATVTLTCEKLKGKKFGPITRMAIEHTLDNGQTALVFRDSGEWVADAPKPQRTNTSSKPKKKKVPCQDIKQAYEQGMTTQQIAIALNMQEAAVRQAKSRPCARAEI